MEVAWEALEDAGVVAEQLAGSNVGVYIGAFTLDNQLKQMSSVNRDLISTHTAVGSTMTILSNRISYHFDLRGPSLSVDTACSSSLVAFHLACQDLWRGACSMALAGGVNVIFAPEYSIAMCKGHFLAPDGRCKSFDERANGYARGEGAGVVVLKPLTRAQADGDRIYALVRATGSNQDGRTSGITVPNPEAQATLIRSVCAEAGVSPTAISYFEAHGTGTAVGDPAEASALGAVLGAERTNGDACAIGSVKANIGHLEAASGVAGLIKATLCLSRRTIPPLANLQAPNPAIPFQDLGLRLPTSPEPMVAGDGLAYAGVNSFGYGGTNACAILSEAPAERTAPANAGARPKSDEPELPYLLALSARSKEALGALAEGVARKLGQPGAPALRDVCYSAGARRSHHDLRLAVIGDSRESLVEELMQFAENPEAGNLVSAGPLVKGGRPVFVFTGMGPQWWGMGQELFQVSKVFRETARACDAVFQRLAGWSILDEMLLDEQHSKVQETQIAQPANFVLQVGLAALQRSLGVEPAAIVGHSVGEVSAAYVAGALDLEDALRVSYHRSRVQKKAAGLGSMLAVGLSVQEAEELLAEQEAERAPDYAGVSVAAANSPTSTTLSGDTAALKSLAETLDAKDVFHRFLQVEVPYHSPLMEPLRDDLLAALDGLRPQPPEIPLYSTVTGEPVEDAIHDAAYWYRNVRQPVYFAKAVQNLVAGGHKVFLEVGPHPVLANAVKECLTQAGEAGTTIGTLRRREPERRTLMKGLGGLYAAGCNIDWRKLCGEDAGFVPLVSYPWQRETYWHESPRSWRDRVGEPHHPLLGNRVPGPQSNWETALHRSMLPYLDDHHVEQLRVLPGAAYVEAGLAIQGATGKDEACALENLVFHNALVIDDGDEPLLRCTFDEARREYAVFSRRRDEDENWQLHATGDLPDWVPGEDAAAADLAALRDRLTERVDAETHYRSMAKRGLQYGRYFQGVRELWLHPSEPEILARIEAQAEEPADIAYRLHPALLDACFQALLSITAGEDTFVPIRIRSLRFFRRPGLALWCHGSLRSKGQNTIEGDLTLLDEAGTIAQVRGVLARRLTDKQSRALDQAADWLYRFEWVREARAEDASSPARSGKWLVFVDRGCVGDAVVKALSAAGVEAVIEVRPGAGFHREDPKRYRIRPQNKQDFTRLLDSVGGEQCQGIAYLWGLDAPAEPDDPVGSADVAVALRLVQALAEVPEFQSSRLFVVTRAAQIAASAEEGIVEDGWALAQSPITGLLRVAMNEYPDFGYTSIDLDPRGEGLEVEDVLAELLAARPEDEIALRGGERYVHRLTRTPEVLDDLALLDRVEPVEPCSPFALEFAIPGVVSSARLREVERSTPGEGEIEIAIRGAGLHASDLAESSGAAESPSGLPPQGDAAGIEVAGTVTAVGEGISGLAVGDPVVAYQSGAVRNYAMLVPAKDFVARRPEGLSPEASLGLLPFVAATYALQVVALQPGERVLIHAATELGWAAVQIALQKQAEVFATAMTAEQRQRLEALGVTHVIDGSPATFPEQIMTLTEGEGVDVALGAVDSEILKRSIALLGSLGRYVHAGGRHGSPNNLRIELPPDCTITVTIINTDRLMAQCPERFHGIWDAVSAKAASLTPPSPAVFPVGQIVEALRAVEEQSAPKVLVAIPEEGTIERLSLAKRSGLFSADASYLITGGFGGLGLEIAKWMAREGAGHLALVGRRGAATDEAKRAVDAMRRAGTQILELAADVADRAQVEGLLGRIAEELPPMRGLLHTAAVFDDAPLRDLDQQRFDAVMRPKALGAWHLHDCTTGLDLDFFIMFSSIAAQVGSPGQASYVAANAYLDALAQHRRARGLAATSINWGAIGEVGIVSRLDMVKEYLERVGNKPLTPDQVIGILARVIRSDSVQVSVVDMDWRQWADFHPAWASSQRFKHLVAAEANGADQAGNAWLESLAGKDDEAAEAMLTEHLLQSVAATMQMPAERVDAQQSLVNMGLDSLMAMELQVSIERDFGIKIATLELMKGVTIAQLAVSLRRRLEEAIGATTNGEAAAAKGSDGPETTPDAFTAASTLEQLDQLSSREVDALLENLAATDARAS